MTRGRVEANRPWAATMGYSRARILLADESRWEEAARAHGEVFADVRPANTTVGGLRSVDPDILVEIEVTAIVTG